MSLRDEQFSERLATKLSKAAMVFALPSIPSSQLSDAMRAYTFSPGHSSIYIPHYWAVYVHDGRGPFGPVVKQFLVWFRNPKDDPRLDNGKSPERAADLIRLTKAQYKAGLAANRQARALGRVEPMVVREWAGPADGSFFFANEPGGGMYGFVDKANEIGAEEWSAHVNRELKDVLDLEGTVTVSV